MSVGIVRQLELVFDSYLSMLKGIKGEEKEAAHITMRLQRKEEIKKKQYRNVVLAGGELLADFVFALGSWNPPPAKSGGGLEM